MPTYTYRCKECGYTYEKRKRFSEDHDKECPSCEVGEVRNVINSVGVVFKGTGFYVTDSRKKTDGLSTSAKADGETAKGDGGETKSAEKSADSAATTKADPKPKPKETTKSSA